MPLSVIGAGFGRTGTLSLKLALERLGFAPCHHMVEVFARPEQASVWRAAADGDAVDWDALLAGYGAAVDWPAAHFWRELATHYPAAKVILTLRDPDSWHRSICATIARAAAADSVPDPGAQAVMAMGRSLLERIFAGRLADPDHAKAAFRHHIDTVKASLPRERLLVFEAGEGWEPLCRFLARPVPDEPFPRANSTAEFWQKTVTMAAPRT